MIYKPVTAGALMRKDAQLMRITDEDTGKFIECTPDHKVWTENRGYVMAKELKEDDILKIGRS